MAKQRIEASWIEIDVATLSDQQQAAYHDYKDAYAEMKAARQLFEGAMSEGTPEGKRMVFGYNFGKLSVALVADERKPVKAKTTLAEFLAAQANGGYRA